MASVKVLLESGNGQCEGVAGVRNHGQSEHVARATVRKWPLWGCCWCQEMARVNTLLESGSGQCEGVAAVRK